LEPSIPAIARIRGRLEKDGANRQDRTSDRRFTNPPSSVFEETQGF
jgi:hypothetical protein